MPPTQVIPILMMITIDKALYLEDTMQTQTVTLWHTLKEKYFWIILELPSYKAIKDQRRNKAENMSNV